MFTATHSDPIALQARQMLQRRRETLRALLRSNGAHASALRDGACAPEWVDRAVVLEEERLLSRLEQQEGRELAEVEQALERIEQGRFGTCERPPAAAGRPRGPPLPRLQQRRRPAAARRALRHGPVGR